MRRDPELFRQILLAIEESETDPDDSFAVQIDGRTERETSYHIMLLAEAGYVLAVDLSCMAGDLEWEAQRLTFAGHEFLDVIRDGEVWRRTKEAGAAVGGGSLQVLLEVGKQFGKRVLAERTGISLE